MYILAPRLVKYAMLHTDSFSKAAELLSTSSEDNVKAFLLVLGVSSNWFKR